MATGEDVTVAGEGACVGGGGGKEPPAIGGGEGHLVCHAVEVGLVTRVSWGDYAYGAGAVTLPNEEYAFSGDVGLNESLI